MDTPLICSCDFTQYHLWGFVFSSFHHYYYFYYYYFCSLLIFQRNKNRNRTNFRFAQITFIPFVRGGGGGGGGGGSVLLLLLLFCSLLIF